MSAPSRLWNIRKLIRENIHTFRVGRSVEIQRVRRTAALEAKKRKYLNGPILEFLKFQINKPSIGEVKDVSGATQCIPLQHAMDFEQDIKTIFMAHVYQLFRINQIGNMI